MTGKVRQTDQEMEPVGEGSTPHGSKTSRDSGRRHKSQRPQLNTITDQNQITQHTVGQHS
jgi:hypothetical protein